MNESSKTSSRSYTHSFFVAAGARGGKASAALLTPEQRTAKASRAARARWSKRKISRHNRRG